jgi:hypothetical protein
MAQLNLLVLYWAMNAVCSQIHTKHTTTVWADYKVSERYTKSVSSRHEQLTDIHTHCNQDMTLQSLLLAYFIFARARARICVWTHNILPTSYPNFPQLLQIYAQMKPSNSA